MDQVVTKARRSRCGTRPPAPRCPHRTAAGSTGFATFTLGYVAFQVFTVDYVAADLHQASLWNDHAPSSLAQALPRIWPPLLGQQEISWPPQAFAAPDWDRLVTWDGALRSRTDGGLADQR
jgi:hypothetical protein